jgi:single-strand DNA-binding protein
MADNTITIIGNLTREPELRFTTGGNAICNFGVAVNRRYMQNNEWVDAPTQFFNVTTWGQYGENIAASLNKGSRVIVTGRLEFRKYENKDGVEVTTHDINADEVGVILKYATCEIARNERTVQGAGPANAQQAPRDPQPPRQQAYGRPADPVYGDEEPF